MSIQHIAASSIDPMRRSINKDLMVSFINADLLNRFNLDVRKSTVLYDEDMVFKYALNGDLPDGSESGLIELGVRFVSKGV